ncbi:MAG TPA: single-stranded-DNA-specific exonuclease RecJ [Stellaceae bacterium]|nr:single-stranded-DNA-specific exonuclease RecJ [Stellaceae bacterium]
MDDQPPAERADGSDAFLGVGLSLGGRRWMPRQAGGPGEDRLVAALAQRLGHPEVICRLLAARGVVLDDCAKFLNPTLRDHLPDPSTLADMDKAASRLADAVVAGRRIAVFGDYDVDGGTSAALLSRFLAHLGQAPLVHIPDRRKEGYGPNAPALAALREAGAEIVVTVDCGTTAHEPLAAASSYGLEVIVIDHHAAEPALPVAYAVVNPNRLDDISGLGYLAAVGVTFLLVVAINRVLRARGYYGQVPEPSLMQWLDLVALGTVCDVVPLTGVNRALVSQGLKVLAQRGNPGIAALADSAAITEKLDAYHLGFALGPRVNAGGRVGQADLGTRLLSTDDPLEAARLATALEGFNVERREIEALVLAEAVAQVETFQEGRPPIVIVHGRDWHAGVIGVVASRLKDRYNRPALVIAWEGDEEKGLVGKGSGRSIAGFDLGAAIIAARQSGLLLAGGGHRMAAGFSLDPAKLADFQAFMATRLGEGGAIQLQPELNIDGLLSLTGANGALVATLAGLGPFGSGNSEPRFVLPRLKVLRADVVGQNHVRCILGSGLGSTERLKAIAFRALETPLGQALLRSDGALLHVAGHLRADSWQGRDGVQLFIEDAAFV